MGVQDFRFYVTSVPEMANDSTSSTTHLPSSSSFESPTRPVSFQTLVQLQRTKSSVGSYLNQPGSIALTTRRSEPSLTEQARSHKKSFSLQDEISVASQQIRKTRPSNPIATHFDVDTYSPVELPTDKPFVANDLSTDLVTLFPFQSEETKPNRPNHHELHPISTGDLSTIPATTFSEILTDRHAIRRKVVIAGDPFCGKSSLCS